MTKQVHTEKQVQDIRVLYNSDIKIIDFLSDLHDREPIRSLQRFKDFGNLHTACLLFNCKEDGLFVLLLWDAPFYGNEDGNHLSLYVHPDIVKLGRFFKVWNESIHENPNMNKDAVKALDDILRLIYYNWALIQDKDTQADWLG